MYVFLFRKSFVLNSVRWATTSFTFLNWAKHHEINLQICRPVIFKCLVLVWHWILYADKGLFPRTPVPVPFGTCICFTSWDQSFSRTCRYFSRLCTSNILRYFLDFVTPTDRPKSVRNCCLIELFCGVVCVATLPLWHFCWYRGVCHRTGSDLLLFVFV